MLRLRPVFVTAVLIPLSVHATTLVLPVVVPIAYKYLVIPDCASELAVQLAESCVVLVVYEISAPMPSLTVAIVVGEETSTALTIPSKTRPPAVAWFLNCQVPLVLPE